MKWEFTLEELKGLLGDVDIQGCFDGKITSIGDLRTAKAGDLSFLRGTKFARFLAESQASVILVPSSTEGAPGPNQAWIHVEDPSLSLAHFCGHIESMILSKPEAGVHPTAIIDPGATIDPSASIGPYCLVAEGATIGANTVLESQVRVEKGATIGEDTTIRHACVIGWGSRVGDRCILFPGVVLGADGFGYHSDASGHTRLPQIGTVVVEDDVEIGAHTCIDRARFAETTIGQGTKIDNLVQIGHNLKIGKHCIICSQVGMAGSAELGDFVVLAGQVGINGHIKVGDGVTATGQSGISKSIPPGVILGGTPARPHREAMKREAHVNKIPDMLKRLKALEEDN
ncbi:MAG: UDP-3-O-(3-hydroxymyristoyl)glucosamine N-acyltransferase [Puniceicoccaceae bacterium]